MAIKPLKDNVLVRPDTGVKTTPGGIILYGTSHPVHYGEVVGFGAAVTELKEGDRVAYYPHSGSIISDEGLLVMKDVAVLAIVDAT